jgi:serine/threonine-protein kinase RsbW
MIEEDFDVCLGLDFSSDITNIHQVEEAIENLVKSHRLRDELLGNILVSVTEAINNAIVHGNQNDITKRVDFKLFYKPHLLICTVSDEGLGFNYDCLPDPTAPENIEKLTGRGVFLMKQLADEVQFSHNGAKVSLSFYC